MFFIKKIIKNITNLSAVKIITYHKINREKRKYIKTHPECALCGKCENLEVHHIKPIHLFPEEALNHENFMVLCDKDNNGCHFKWGIFQILKINIIQI